jgi:myo-inositol 2-dehydrogenase/D-chiro-inositol 1-dehydrogenase
MQTKNGVSRRHFLGHAVTASALTPLLTGLRADAAEPAPVPGPATPAIPLRKVNLGLIGCGGRGSWIAKFFLAHGGFEIHAAADYFPNVVQAFGKAHGLDPARCFSGLSGYRKLLESGVEAVAIEDVPYFYPEQAAAAVAAGQHVYIAKPLAVDVPGALQIGRAGQAATKANLCFVVDYQFPTDPAAIEVAKRLQQGALGRLSQINSYGMAWHAWPDPAPGPGLSSRFRNQIWLSDTVLSGDTIVSYDIHIIDTLVWALGRRPIAAYGIARTLRENPHGDRTDALSVLYEFEDGLVWTHVTQALDNNFTAPTLSGTILGTTAEAFFHYGGKVYIRGGDQGYSGKSPTVFNDGVTRNIATFHQGITGGPAGNPTVQRAVDGHLTAILGREAAARKTRITMAELIQENRKLEADLMGLQA